MKEEGKKWNVVREARRPARSVIIYCLHESLFLSRRHALNEQLASDLPVIEAVSVQNYIPGKNLPPTREICGTVDVPKGRLNNPLCDSRDR